jgi:hypothetical protein
MANGDFAIGPDDPSVDLSDENPLPYYTTTTVGAGVTAALVEDGSAGSGNTLRFRVAGGTTSGNSVAISRFVPVPSTRNRAFLFVPEVFCISATATANARVTVAYQYFELDQTTSTGTGDSTFETFTTIGGASTIRFTANQLRFNAPSDAAFIKVTVTCSTTGTVAAQSDVFVCELRLISGQADLYIAERTSPSTKEGARIVQESGDLKITPVVGGTGSITLNAATDVSGGLEVTGNIDAGGSIASVTLIQAGGVFRTIQASSGSLAFTARVTGEGTPRFAVFCNGVMEWGAGGARDLNLYRSSAGNLRTDMNLNVGGALNATGNVNGDNFNGTALVCDGIPTTTNTSNNAVWVNNVASNYTLRRFTSSQRYKTNIEDADDVVLEASKKIKPRHFTSLLEDENSATRLGFIAEEIEAAGLTHAVGYDAEGRVETIDTTALLAALWHRVNDLEDRLKALEEA